VLVVVIYSLKFFEVFHVIWSRRIDMCVCRCVCV